MYFALLFSPLAMTTQVTRKLCNKSITAVPWDQVYNPYCTPPPPLQPQSFNYSCFRCSGSFFSCPSNSNTQKCHSTRFHVKHFFSTLITILSFIAYHFSKHHSKLYYHHTLCCYKSHLIINSRYFDIKWYNQEIGVVRYS